MGFDTDGFLRAQSSPRTREVEVPVLADWFGEGEPAIWIVRNLTANEVARVNDAEAKHKREAALAEALMGAGRLGDEAKAALGLDEKKTEPDYARRIEILIAGSVAPACNRQLARRIGKDHAQILYLLTNTILELTGQGADVSKKLTGSGETPPSEPPSP